MVLKIAKADFLCADTILNKPSRVTVLYRRIMTPISFTCTSISLRQTCLICRYRGIYLRLNMRNTDLVWLPTRLPSSPIRPVNTIYKMSTSLPPHCGILNFNTGPNWLIQNDFSLPCGYKLMRLCFIIPRQT